jgi:uncharacterized membrane protein
MLPGGENGRQLSRGASAMRAFWIRFLKRSVPVALILGVTGFIFAEAFLMLHRMNGGTPDPANDAVRWRTPMNMAIFGVVVLFVMEVIASAIRRKPAAPSSPPASVEARLLDASFQHSGPPAS